MNDHFEFIRLTMRRRRSLIQIKRGSRLRHGVLVVDPYTEIEHKRRHDRNRAVSRRPGCAPLCPEPMGAHWFVAHPAKMPRENGKLPVPTLYDISGSANWANKADIGLVVYRNDQSTMVDVIIQKVRHKWVGQRGRIEFHYDRLTGRYSAAAHPLAGAGARRS